MGKAHVAAWVGGWESCKMGGSKMGKFDCTVPIVALHGALDRVEVALIWGAGVVPAVKLMPCCAVGQPAKSSAPSS